MQEVITYIIGIVAAVIIGRWLYRVLSGKEKDACSSCENCKHRGKNCD